MLRGALFCLCRTLNISKNHQKLQLQQQQGRRRSSCREKTVFGSFITEFSFVRKQSVKNLRRTFASLLPSSFSFGFHQKNRKSHYGFCLKIEPMQQRTGGWTDNNENTQTRGNILLKMCPYLKFECTCSGVASRLCVRLNICQMHLFLCMYVCMFVGHLSFYPICFRVYVAYFRVFLDLISRGRLIFFSIACLNSQREDGCVDLF